MRNKEDLSKESQSHICEDAREARLEIASWKYDDELLWIVKKYFSDTYKNQNGLDISKENIRNTFLQDFELRKSLIEFGQAKGLGKQNPQVREALKKQMTFEGESRDEIRNGYTKQIQAAFFVKQESKNEKADDEDVSEKKDPLLSLLNEWDQTKVILAKKYGGQIQTYTKLIAILSFADTDEQEKILKYLVGDEVKKHITQEETLKIIDMVAENAYDYIPYHYKHFLYYEREEKNWDIDSLIDTIIYIIGKFKAKKISLESISKRLNAINFPLYEREEKDRKERITKSIEALIHGLDKETVEKEYFTWLKNLFKFIDGNRFHRDIHINNKYIDLGKMEKTYKEKKIDTSAIQQIRLYSKKA